MIRHGDCAHVLDELDAGSAALVYIDPPFFTGRRFRASDGHGFDDVFDGMDAYLWWMAERLDACRRVLAPSGVLVVHADDHASHYLRVLLDEGFSYGGESLGVITWKRTHAHSGRGKTWGRVHDTLIVHANGPDWTFHPPPSAETDLWLDIVGLNPASGERTGWPTQKPLALLERIVLTFTDPGDLVVDGFCGSGTSLAAAVMHGRRAFGCDVSERAVEIVRGRLAAIAPQLSLEGAA